MKTVFLSGATGAVGSALVPLFLAEEGTSIRLLLRADSPAHLRQRLDSLCDFWGVTPDSAPVAGRVEVFAGDVSLPRLGLNESDYQRLAAEVTHVVHSAGVVKLNQPIEEARRSAVTSARQVVSLCRAGQAAGPFRKLEFVSTVGVAGRTKGLIPEKPIRHARTFHNTYEAAKAEAEEYLFGEMGAGLAATVHRPSMVVGDSRTGKVIHFQVFYYLAEFLAGRRTFGVVPDTGRVKLDVIPADYVAEAIRRSADRPEAAGRVFHLCSGPDAAPTLTALTEQVRALFPEGGRNLPPLRRLPRGVIRALVALGTRVTLGKTRKALQTLPYFLAYLDEEQEFDNSRTRAFFAEGGPHVPPVADYLPNVLRYYLAEKTQAADRPRAATAGA